MVKKWTNKLYAKAVLSDGRLLIAPLVNITPTFNTPHTYEHDLREDNSNITRGNFTYTFTMLVRALKDIDSGENPVKVVTQIQQQGLEFDVLIGEQRQNESEPQQWAFERVLLKRCYITSNVGTNNQGASPTATFTAVAGEINIDGENYSGTNPNQP